MEQHEIQRARLRAVSIASAVSARQVSPVIGAIELNRLRSAVDVPDGDPDFEAFSLIDSECDGLPIGPVRQYWAADALEKREGRVTQAERWAMETAEQEFRNVVARFAQPPTRNAAADARRTE